MPPAPKKQAKQNRKASMSADELVDWVRERIRIGQFAPGQRLVESDIIRQSGASRHKVRDALQRLASEGLVSIEAFRGASVRSMGWDEVRQIYEARMALESFAARQFATTGDEAQKQALQATQDEMDDWVARGDHQEFAKLNTKWHNLIVDAAGNDYFRRFLSRLTIPIYRLLFTGFYSTDRIVTANVDHQRITRAIVTGKADEAEKLMREHILNGLNALSEIDARLF